MTKEEIQKAKQELLETLEKLPDCLKSHKRFVIECVKYADVKNLTWFFTDGFMYAKPGSKKHESYRALFYVLPYGFKRAMGFVK